MSNSPVNYIELNLSNYDSDMEPALAREVDELREKCE